MTRAIYPEDIRTALTRSEAGALQSIAANKRVLEIGSLLGASTIVLASVAKSVVAVDPHRGYPTPSSPSTLDKFLANLTRYGMRDKVQPIVGFAEQCLSWPVRGFDLIFIDNTEISKELLPWALISAPAVALHDCGHPVWVKAQEAADMFPGHNRVDSLAIWI